MSQNHHEDFSPERSVSEPNMIDAMGRKWKVAKTRQGHMFHARYEPWGDNGKGQALPKEVEGLWTKPDWLENSIKRYIEKTWDKADRARPAAKKVSDK